MASNNPPPNEVISGHDLNDMHMRQKYEAILTSQTLHRVDISPRNDFTELSACFYQNGRISLYVPSKLSFSIEQMVATIRSACNSETPLLIDLITGMENDPEQIMKIKKIFNGKL